MKRTSILLTGMLIILLLCALSGLVNAECRNWDVGDPLDGEEVTSPPDNGVYLAGAKVTFSYTDPIDPDEYTTDEPGPCCPEPCTENDWLSTNHPRWTATSGSFPDGNIGNSVDWQAPDGEVSDITVEVYDDDRPLDLDACDSGSRDDDEQLMDTRTIETIIPEVIMVNFQPPSASYNLKTHDGDDTVSSASVEEYQRTFGGRGPHTVHAAAFKKNTKLKAKATIYHDEDLTRSESVDVAACASGVGTSITELSYVGATFGPAWACVTSTLESDYNLDDSINYYDAASLEWGYWVPDGSDTWISMTPATAHPICVTADAPASSDSRYEWVARASCKAADGQDSDDPKTIVDDIYDSLAACARVDDWSTKLNYDFPNPPPGGIFTVDLLLDQTEASCGNWINYLAALCNVQGVDSADGLRKGNLRFNATTNGAQPWRKFRVEHNGTNNTSSPASQTIDLVDDDKYPDPMPWDVSSVSKNIWWESGGAFHDHSLVFLDLSGDTDYLYDPSFPNASPSTVTYFGNDTYVAFGGSANFITNYFETSCPYLFGWIQVGSEWEYVHIHTNDFDRPLADPDYIMFYWDQE
jgi:hypothetical protein